VEQNKEDFVRSILSAGARADLFNEQTGNAPVHVAVESGSLSMTKLLLEGMTKRPKINKAKIGAFTKNGQTVLHIAARKGDVTMLRYLLSHPDLDNVDPRDLAGGQTPLYLAAKGGRAEACELLISFSASLETKCFGKTVKQVIAENLPSLDPHKVRTVDNSKKKCNIGEHLSRLLDLAQRNATKRLSSNAHNLLEFRIYMQQMSLEELNSFDASGMSLMQKACNHGLQEHVQCMLEHKMNPSAVVGETSSKPVLLAAYNGFYQVLEELISHTKRCKKSGDAPINFAVTEAITKESVLHWVLKRPNPTDDPRCDYKACLDVLLAPETPSSFNAQIKKIINHKDNRKNAPLHYATQQWNQAVVRQLLERGANIGIRFGAL
jgi:ankyrin repeat protein